MKDDRYISIQGCNAAGSRDLFDIVALEVVIAKLVKLTGYELGGRCSISGIKDVQNC